MMGQVQGHTRMFVVRDLNQLVRPSTMMTTKATIHTVEYVNLLGGVVQAATGDAIVDCVIEGILPKDGLDELCMIIMIWARPALRRGRQSRPEGPLPHQLRGDEARHRPRHQGRADHRRAHRQPQDGEALTRSRTSSSTERPGVGGCTGILPPAAGSRLRQPRRDAAHRAQGADRARWIGVAARRPPVLLDERLAPLAERRLVGLADGALNRTGVLTGRRRTGNRQILEIDRRGCRIAGGRLDDGLGPAGQVDLRAVRDLEIDARPLPPPDLPRRPRK